MNEPSPTSDASNYQPQPVPVELLALLEQVAAGQRSVAEVAGTLTQAGFSPDLHRTRQTSDACVDVGRLQRCGLPEAVFAPGKRAQTIVEVFEQLLAAGQPCLATRMSDEQIAVLKDRFPECIVNSLARTVRIPAETPQQQRGRVIVVSAGTCDRPVAEEALETLLWLNCPTELILDIGVAGPQRLLDRVGQLRTATALIVVAGMEGALPSVVAGHVAVPVFAVPTSVGYGAAFGGVAALLSMLNSCAANVAVVNIDAGFKAACLAALTATNSAPKTSPN